MEVCPVVASLAAVAAWRHHHNLACAESLQDRVLTLEAQLGLAKALWRVGQVDDQRVEYKLSSEL